MQESKAKQWMGLAEPVREQTKASLLAGLGAPEQDVRHTAALVIAKVAAIEIPRQLWGGLIPMLLDNIGPGSPVGPRHASLEVLGYICEELGLLEDDYLDESQVNNILTGVVSSMGPEEQNPDIRYAATVALNNALDFAESNFKKDQERNYIMTKICEGTIAENAKVRQAAWECLVRAAENYYETFPMYIQEIFNLTKRAMNDPEEGVVLQALEFWSSIADEEIYCLEEEEENPETPKKSHHFIKGVLGQLVPLLLEQLTKQDEFADTEGAWNVALAAGTALGLAATVAGNPIVPLVMPYVQQNIGRNSTPEDWRYREAATFAFGCILDGPDVNNLGPLAREGLGHLFSALTDPNPLVKNTTAWTVGRIFEFVHGSDLNPPLLNQENLQGVVQTLLHSLRDDVHIAEKVCYAISQLASGFSEMDPSPLSPYFETIMSNLLETSARHTADPGEAAKIQVQAFEAINEVVMASSSDAIPLVSQLVPLICSRIGEISSVVPQSAEASEHQIDTLNLLCAVINVAITKLSLQGDHAKQLAAQGADTVMQALLTVFVARPHLPSYVPEEAMLAVGALTYVTGKDFIRYMNSFYPFLEKGLKQAQEWQTCLVTLGVLGDVCRALEEGIVEFCDNIMMILIKNLEDEAVPRSVKPAILASFGDIALAIGDNFIKYLNVVAPPLQAAAQMSVELAKQADDDEDQIAFVNSLRQSILEAWSGMFNGLSKENSDAYLRQISPMLIDYIETIAADPNENLSVMSRAADAIGDIASNINGVGALFMQKPYVTSFLEKCKSKPGPDEKASWALKMVQKSISMV